MTERIAELFNISTELAAVIAPVLIIHFILVVIVLIDMIRNWQDRNFKVLWLIVSLAFNLIGPVLYFIIGRKRA